MYLFTCVTCVGGEHSGRQAAAASAAAVFSRQREQHQSSSFRQQPDDRRRPKSRQVVQLRVSSVGLLYKTPDDGKVERIPFNNRLH